LSHLDAHLEDRSSEPTRQVSFLRSLRANPNCVPIGIIGLIILAVNMPALVDIVTRDPVQLFSGIPSTAPHQVLPGTSIIDPNAGYITQALGHLVAMDWLHGHIPWWNPYEGLGVPLAGGMQSGAFFPLVLLLQNAFGFVVFHVVLEGVAGSATYFLLRRLGLGRAAATAGGVAFGLCGTLAWFEHATANPVAFLPLAILGVERAREASMDSRRYGWRMLAVALALSVVAGFPEVAYLDGLLVLVWAAVRLFSVHDRWRALLGKLALGGLAGVLLSAPALVAFVDYLPHANVGAHAGAVGNVFLPMQSLAQTILPYGFGPLFGFKTGASAPLLTIMWSNAGGYLDASLALCAFIGLVGTRWRALRMALALWVLISMSKTFGVTWVSHLLNHLPGFQSIAFYRYSQTSWEFAVIVLAAFGIDDLARRRVHPALIVGAGVVTLGVIASAAAQAWPVMSAVRHYAHAHAFPVASGALAALAVVTVVVGGVFMYSQRPGSRSRIGQLLVAGAVMIEATLLFAAPLLSAPRPTKVDTALVHYLQGHLGLARFATLGPIQPNFGSYFGLAEINENDLPEPKTFTTFVQKYLDPNSVPLLFTGTTKTDPDGPGPAQALATNLASYEASGVKFVVTFASGSDVFGSSWPPAGLTPAPRRVYVDAAAAVWQLPAPTAFFTTSGAFCHVRAEGEADAEVRCDGPAVLRRLELPMPGWSAQAGASQVAVRSDGAFQSIHVGAGTTHVRFSFTPPYGDASLWAALVVALLLLSSFLVHPRSPRARSTPPAGGER
jgi:hypothetical protein